MMFNDENYISPKELKEWFVKNPNEPYRKKSTIEFYYSRGFLKGGKNTEEDRLNAGLSLYGDYELSGLQQERAVDFAKPKVDGGGSGNLNDIQIFHRNRFNRAICKIKCSIALDVVNLVVLEDRDIRRNGANNNWFARKSNLAIRKFLIMGLDDLVAFYTPKAKNKGITGYSVKGVFDGD